MLVLRSAPYVYETSVTYTRINGAFKTLFSFFLFIRGKGEKKLRYLHFFLTTKTCLTVIISLVLKLFTTGAGQFEFFQNAREYRTRLKKKKKPMILTASNAINKGTRAKLPRHLDVIIRDSQSSFSAT